MKRIIVMLLTLVALISPTLISGQASAAVIQCGHLSGTSQDLIGNTDVCKTVDKSSGNPIIKILKGAIEVISFVAGALSIIFVLVSAIRFIIGGGGSEGVATARNSLIYVLVGVAVVVLSQSLVVFVLNKLQ